MGEEVDVVEEYKYPIVHLDNWLDWRRNTDAIYKNRQSKLYFLGRLRSFSLQQDVAYLL